MAGRFGFKDLVDVISVYEVRKLPLNLSRDGEKCLMGLCCPDSRQIIIEPQQNPMEMKDTLLHEALHAWLYVSGKAYGMSDAQMEKFVRQETDRLMRDMYGRR